MTPDDFFRNAYYPKRYTSIPSVDELPSSPYLLPCSGTHFIGVILTVAAELVLMSIIVLARIKAIVRVVLQKIRFERPVLGGPQTGWRRGFSERNNMVIDQIWIVAGPLRHRSQALQRPTVP